jgi:hypothetical protein
MLDEESETVQSYHICQRRDCTRVFRDVDGYSDWVNREFDRSRALARACTACGAVLYLAEVDGLHKIEIWECHQPGCGFTEESQAPSAR